MKKVEDVSLPVVDPLIPEFGKQKQVNLRV